MDYAAEITWRDRPGVATRYLAVGNRESAYAGDRAAVQFWMMPHRFRIRVGDPAVRWLYDVAAGVAFRPRPEKGGVSFQTTVPPALGRVYAVSTTDTIEHFEPGRFGGLGFDALERRVAQIAAGPEPAPSAKALHPADIHEWLAARRGGKLTISYGDAAYRPAAERLAAWLKRRFDIAAEPTGDDGRFEVGEHGFQVRYIATDAEVLVGNAWSNNLIASLDCTWPFNTPAGPAATSGRLTATYAWPGGDRGFAALMRELEFRQADHTTFGVRYGETRGFAPRGVDAASKGRLRRRLLVLASTPAGAANAVAALADTKRHRATPTAYAKPGQLAPLPAGTASLYRTPWRANVRTVSAAEALKGIGVYYKHVPNTWTLAEHTNVMKQLAACGVRRLRIAPHHAIYITRDWKRPRDRELTALRNELRAARAAGIRPCVVFVHVPPIGKPGTRELQEWWRQGELMPAGNVGSEELRAYLDKTYDALRFVLNEARAAGFTKPGTYDLEMGQGLWWGAPAVPRPLPSTTLRALRPGGRIYEFDLALIRRLRKGGYVEPTLWWGQTHHHFEHCRDDDVPRQCAGWAVSFYSSWSGTTRKTWLTGAMFDRRRRGPNDVWPIRPPLRFLEGKPPELVLARPEGWMADRTRRDNLIEMIRASKLPVAIPSLGTVPDEIPGASAGPLDGWQIKRRAMTRSLAFWLNQGAKFVLLHSAYEPGRRDRGEMCHSLIPNPIDPAGFRWQDAPPLVTLRAFCDALKGARPVARPAGMSFRCALSPDPVLVPPKLRASDCAALLAFQIDERTFAVAAYIMGPNVARRMQPLRMTLEIDRRVTAAGVSTAKPATGLTGTAQVTERTARSTTLCFDVHDDVTWLRFAVE